MLACIPPEINYKVSLKQVQENPYGVIVFCLLGGDYILH